MMFPEKIEFKKNSFFVFNTESKNYNYVNKDNMTTFCIFVNDNEVVIEKLLFFFETKSEGWEYIVNRDAVGGSISSDMFGVEAPRNKEGSVPYGLDGHWCSYEVKAVVRNNSKYPEALPLAFFHHPNTIIDKIKKYTTNINNDVIIKFITSRYDKGTNNILILKRNSTDYKLPKEYDNYQTLFNMEDKSIFY